MEEATQGAMQGIMATPDIQDMDTTTIRCRGCMARYERNTEDEKKGWQKTITN